MHRLGTGLIDTLRNAIARYPGSILTMLTLLVAIVAIILLGQPATLTVAVAPSGGTEPALMRAFAEALEEEKAGIRLKLVPFPGVIESAAALERREVDLAVVRPDVAMPANGLSLAILRELAALVVVPGKQMTELSELGGKRLAVLANRSADPPLFQKLLGHAGLDLRTAEDGRPITEDSVALVPLQENELAAALREKRVDAVAVLTTATTAAAERVITAARDASADREAQFLALPDVQALVARFPRLQSVSIPAGLFGGEPRLPPEETATIGASHRLMARSSMSRSRAAEVTQRLFEMRARLAATVPAADDMTFPPYEDTAGATTARIPIHPGALDYFEREQESFIERYESFIYLVAILGGSVVSMFAWLRAVIGRARRERINVATARLLKLRSDAARITDPEKLSRMQEEVDAVAASIARHALRRRMESPAIEAGAIAVEAARETIRRAAERARRPA